MRLLLETFLILLVIYAGWNQSFRDHAVNMFPQSGVTASQAARTTSGALGGEEPWTTVQAANRVRKLQKNPEWMWKEGQMDRAYKKKGDQNAQ